MKPGISAVIVVHNQVDLLENCLKSISKWIDEIIIIDLESTENVKRVADSYKAKYFTHKLVPIVENIPAPRSAIIICLFSPIIGAK